METYDERLREVMRDLIVKRVCGDALRAALAIVEHSLAQKTDAARFHEQGELAVILGWDKTQCSRAIRALEQRQIVRCYRHAGSWWYEICPCGSWLPPLEGQTKTAVPATVIAAARKQWASSLARRQNDPEQRDLLPWSIDELPEEPTGAGEAITRHDAGVDGPSTFGIDPVVRPLGVDGPSTLADQRELTVRQLASRARARTREHEHEHEDRATPYMIHEHAPGGGGRGRGGRCAPPVLMDDGQRDLMRMIEELIPDEDEQRRFRTTWTLRILDWPQIVFKAVGETRIAKLEHRIDTTPGRYLNDVFKRFREVRQRPTTTSKSP